MSDPRRSMILWGAIAAVLLAVALLTATVFTGSQSSVGTNVSAGIVTIALFGVGGLCTVLAARAYARNLLGALSKRKEKQLALADAAQEKRHEALEASNAERDRAIAVLTDAANEQSKASGSLARSLRLQTESISLIRKQTRAILEDLEGRSVEGPDTLSVATEGRDMSRKLLNLVRNGARDTSAQLKPIAPALRDLTARSDDLEAGQRRAMNYLRKDGNIQVILDKLVAAERRLIASVEAGALTNAEEISSATGRSVAELHEELIGMHRDLAELNSRTHQVGADVAGVVPRIGERFELISARIDSAQSVGERSAQEQRDLVTGVRNGLSVISESLTAIVRLTDTTKTDVKAIGPRIDRTGTDVVQQVESLMQLLGRVDTSTRRFPASGGWAMNPDSLLLLSDLVRMNRPKRIVELGSGTSTVWIGTFAESVGAQLISVDHLGEYRDLTAQSLEGFGLTGGVDLRLAELTEIEVNGEGRQWYDPQAFADLEDIDMLIVDGPPKSTGPDPRFPAFGMLRDKLSPGALIVVDDLHREQEIKMVETWMEQDEGLARTPWAAGRTGVLSYRGTSGSND